MRRTSPRDAACCPVPRCGFHQVFVRFVRLEEHMIRGLCLPIIALGLFAVAAPQGFAEAQSLIDGNGGMRYSGYGRGYYGGYRRGYYDTYGYGPYGYGAGSSYRYPGNSAYGYGYGPYYNGYGNAGYYGTPYVQPLNPAGYGIFNSFGIGW